MSLDVYLLGPEKEVACTCECGHQHIKQTREVFFQDNITHNLNEMAKHSGLYMYLWRPEEIDIFTALDLIGPLEKGINVLACGREFYQQFNAPNGWGKFEDLLSFCQRYLRACKDYPEAKIEVSR